MKRELKNDYREMNGKIRISTNNSKLMNEKARKDYEDAILLLLGGEVFEISVIDELTNDTMVNFSVKNGMASVYIDDGLSRESD